jgi:uncharacterized protein (UPF0276 family)
MPTPNAMNCQWSGPSVTLNQLPELAKAKPGMPHIEIDIDELLAHEPSANAFAQLEQLRQHYAFFFHSHGLNLSVGGSLDQGYLKQLKTLAQRFDPIGIIHHLGDDRSGASASTRATPRLDPHTLATVTERVTQIQAYMQRHLLIRNLNAPKNQEDLIMSQAEFFQRLIKRSGCLMALDLALFHADCDADLQKTFVTLQNINPSRIAIIRLPSRPATQASHKSWHEAPLGQLLSRVLAWAGPRPLILDNTDSLPDSAGIISQLTNIEALFPRQRLPRWRQSSAPPPNI